MYATSNNNNNNNNNHNHDNTNTKNVDFLLKEFKTASGEIIDPYEILKVPRKAPKTEVRQAYIGLSRKYHPDGMRNRRILPGKCNNLDDVRDHWERVRLSYEILSNEKMRKKFDRHSAIVDPKAFMSRSAMDAIGWGLSGVSDGLFQIGKKAFSELTTTTETETTKTETAQSSRSI